jgi:hypothetical protein
MNTNQPHNNNGRYLNSKYPIDRIDALPKKENTSIEKTLQVLGRSFEWIAGATKPSEKVLRATVVTHCFRADLINEESLADLACSFNHTGKDLESLILNFRRMIHKM